MLDVALVGTGGMMPLPNRFLSSMLLRVNGKMILTDCGEGTQVSLKMLGWGFKFIDVICITHYHADHISGLPGILLAIGNAGKDEPLTIIGPKGIRQVVGALRIIAPELPFEIEFIECTGEETVYLSGLEITTAALYHRIKCLGFCFHLKRQGRFLIEKAESYGLPKQYWSKLQKNQIVYYDDSEYTPDMVLGPPRKGIKVSYMTDTRPVSGVEKFIEGSDLFICEGMYGEDDKRDKAIAYKHMLFSEAASIAAKGNVSELWLTHFSPSLANPKEFLTSAQRVFKNTVCGRDRLVKTLYFKD